MYLQKILLKNFRNLKKVFLELNPRMNIFIGNNGQGKTNLLEALYFIGTLSSHRTNISREIINWNAEETLIQVKVIKENRDIKLDLKLKKSDKEVRINNSPPEKITDIVGKLNVVLFSPEDLRLVKGSPAKRRNFLNTEVSQVSPYYYHILNKYKHIVKQRNNLLKDLKYQGENSDKKMLSVWNEQLIETGSKIIKKRLEVIEKLKILARLAQRKITGGKENLSINYKQSFKEKFTSPDEIELIFKRNLVNNRKREIERGYTLCGPHRDDLIFKLNDINIRKYGSQGQQRTVALSLKLAELEFMKSEVGEYPVLLLDDVFSELDSQRKNAILGVVAENIQTFITTTENIEELNGSNNNIYYVKKGNITGKVD